MDNRDFRVRASMFITKGGVATGLHNHALSFYDLAVDINPGQANAEMRYVKTDDHYIVNIDLCFPPDMQEEAEGLYMHTMNVPFSSGYVEIHRCGHRINQSCDLIDRLDKGE